MCNHYTTRWRIKWSRPFKSFQLTNGDEWSEFEIFIALIGRLLFLLFLLRAQIVSAICWVHCWRTGARSERKHIDAAMKPIFFCCDRITWARSKGGLNYWMAHIAFESMSTVRHLSYGAALLWVQSMRLFHHPNKSHRNSFRTFPKWYTYSSDLCSWVVPMSNGMLLSLLEQRLVCSRLWCGTFMESVPISFGRTHRLTSWLLQLGTWPYVHTAQSTQIQSISIPIERHRSTLIVAASPIHNRWWMY